MSIIAVPTSKSTTHYSENSSSADIQDFMALLKPGVMSLVVFTYLCSLLLAPQSMHPFMMIVSLSCVAMGSGAAGAINMWYDRDIDAVMIRTAKRPIPAGKIAPNDALAFGVILAIISIMLMMMATNIAAGLWLAFSIAFYVFVYTMALKRRTVQNIVIGGAAGAFPPVIGWVAATGTLSLEPLILFTIIFLWTPPHFWSLALHQVDEYRKVNIPMLPVIKGHAVTCNYIIVYTFLMVLSTLLPFILTPGFFTSCYGVCAILLGVVFIIKVLLLKKRHDKKACFNLFWYSIIYLFTIFAMMILDHCWFINL